MTTGKVYLVGAGPGDPELLTLKAVKALRRAQVILCDDLVNEEILEYAAADARVVRVGKRGGRASTAQSFIDRLMVREARRGRVVVRLKGGDPFIFGRGGEECEALRSAGIDFEVVSGITSGIAAATALGAPLTQRGISRGVIFVAGTEAEGHATDWAALAATGLSLVIYMGVARCGQIQRALIAAGLPPSTPAAAVAHATRPNERRLVTTLAELERDMGAAAIESPAILIVGEVARVRTPFARSASPASCRQR
jgi:uroporphyrin-III C-methyltransferase